MNVFELFATLGIDTTEYDEGLERSERKGINFGSGVKAAVGATTKMMGAAVVAAGAAISAIASKSVTAYASYEQLVGGVKKLFNTEVNSASSWVVENAQQAWKTVGMSASEYIETVTSFASKLVADLGGDTEAAASYADKAVRDMADNANTFGTSMESVQSAYSGFAKGNFTMLDNLKLGYGGTKTEMERLLADAEALTGIHYDIDNFDDIIEAIHVIQTNMGITGTTALQAKETIEGSSRSAKAAWQNLLIAIADENGDVGKAVDNLVTAMFGDENGEGGLVNNIEKRVEIILQGLGTFIEKAAPIIGEELPKIIETILPKILNGALDLIQGILPQLPVLIKSVLQSVTQIAPELITAVLEALPDVIDAILQITPELIKTLGVIIGKLVTEAPMIITEIMESIMTVLPDLLGSIWDLIVNTIFNPLIFEINKILSLFGTRVDYIKTQSNDALIASWQAKEAELAAQRAVSQYEETERQRQIASQAYAEQTSAYGRYSFLNDDQIEFMQFVAYEWANGKSYYDDNEWAELGISSDVKDRFFQDLGAAYHDIESNAFLDQVDEWFSSDYANAIGEQLAQTSGDTIGTQDNSVTLNIDTYVSNDGTSPQDLVNAMAEAYNQQMRGKGVIPD